MNPDIRWRQRFGNFERGVASLDEALENGPVSLSPLEKDGAIRRFKLSFEQAWKTLGGFLEESGFIISPVAPRRVLKDAFSAKILPDDELWIEMLDRYNLVSRDYDPLIFEQTLLAVARHYLPAMKHLRAYLAANLAE